MLGAPSQVLDSKPGGEIINPTNPRSDHLGGGGIGQIIAHDTPPRLMFHHQIRKVATFLDATAKITLHATMWTIAMYRAPYPVIRRPQPIKTARSVGRSVGLLRCYVTHDIACATAVECTYIAYRLTDGLAPSVGTPEPAMVQVGRLIREPDQGQGLGEARSRTRNRRGLCRISDTEICIGWSARCPMRKD